MKAESRRERREIGAEVGFFLLLNMEFTTSEIILVRSKELYFNFTN